MISPKITLLKSPSTGNIEVVIHDSVHIVPGTLFVMPEGSLTLEDAGQHFRDEICSLRRQLEYERRAKKHILKNLRERA